MMVSKQTAYVSEYPRVVIHKAEHMLINQSYQINKDAPQSRYNCASALLLATQIQETVKQA